MKATQAHYQSALALSALGDALGWPQEFSRSKKPPIRQFVAWNKKSGGQYWGYENPIAAGEYSDDTQLMLGIARSILPNGMFWPEYFAYLELPFWLHYERGGGRATKQAAKNLLKYKTLWYQNSYGKADNYDKAGGNGAAMRTLPISLARANDFQALLIETLSQALITHGHPRGIVGALVLACAHFKLIQEGDLRYRALGHFIKESLTAFFHERPDWGVELQTWWAQRKGNYLDACMNALAEMLDMLRLIPEYSQDASAYMQKIGCFSQQTKGSGIATVAAALYFFFKHPHCPEEAIFDAANAIGSDTDTIASMVGGLVGLKLGDTLSSEIQAMFVALQDKHCLFDLGAYLFELTGPRPPSLLFETEEPQRPDKKESLKMVLSWELGLHELFWDLLKMGERISHPVLGMGKLEAKRLCAIENRPNYESRIFKIRFDSGQTVYMQSYVNIEKWEVKESLGKEASQELALAK